MRRCPSQARAPSSTPAKSPIRLRKRPNYTGAYAGRIQRACSLVRTTRTTWMEGNGLGGSCKMSRSSHLAGGEVPRPLVLITFCEVFARGYSWILMGEGVEKSLQRSVQEDLTVVISRGEITPGLRGQTRQRVFLDGGEISREGMRAAITTRRCRYRTYNHPDCEVGMHQSPSPVGITKGSTFTRVDPRRPTWTSRRS